MPPSRTEDRTRGRPILSLRDGIPYAPGSTPPTVWNSVRSCPPKSLSIANSPRSMPIRRVDASSSWPTPRMPTWRSASAPGKSPEIARRRRPTSRDAGRVPRADSPDRPAGAGRHHAHVGQHERSADDPGAAVRRLATSRRRPARTTRPTSTSCAAARYFQQPSRPFRTAALDHIQCGHLDCDAGRAHRRSEPGAVSRHVQQRLDVDLRNARGLQGVSRGGRAEGLPALLEVFDPNVAGGGGAAACS